MFGLGRKAASAPEGQWLERDGERFWLPWKKHARARRLKLLVGSNGPRLTLPPRVSEKAARAFVAEHSDWLWSQWARHANIQQSPLSIGAAAELPWFGQRLPVQWHADRALHILREDMHWRIHTSTRSSDRQLQAALLQAYRQYGEGWFLQRAQRYLPELPKPPTAMRVKPLRSLWGSLNVADTITLDVALLFAPEPVAEYVLVHELCHLLQRNHSPKFWHEVEMRCPDWRDHRDYLRMQGPTIKAEARRLFG
jgi:predicted metal-dependent hydrolase